MRERKLPFSEKLKLEVKQKANFRCCRCQSIGVQVHHIIPQQDGGTDDIDNAAPLCPTCHDSFGGNPEKRKEIIQMRDWWYTKAAEMLNYNPKLSELEQKIDGFVLDAKENFEELKTALKTYTDILIDNMTVTTSGSTASGIVNASIPEIKVVSFDKVGVSDWAVVEVGPPRKQGDNDKST
jgi:hypothetical protein